MDASPSNPIGRCLIVYSVFLVSIMILWQASGEKQNKRRVAALRNLQSHPGRRLIMKGVLNKAKLILRIHIITFTFRKVKSKRFTCTTIFSAALTLVVIKFID